jgi:hypothetical protein
MGEEIKNLSVNCQMQEKGILV